MKISNLSKNFHGVVKTSLSPAFTLAEVLITLTVIGVVAAITVPTIQSGHQETILINRLKQTASIFEQAYRRAYMENGDPRTWEIGTKDSADGAKKLYDILIRDVIRVKDCDTKSGCFSEDYKALFGNKSYVWQPNTKPNYVKGILANGTSFLVWSGGSGCYTHNNFQSCGSIKVDLNGNKPPNRAGVDYFSFTITPHGIVAANWTAKNKNSYGEYCQYGDSSNYNGAMCTGYVLANGNMDYRRKDVSK